MGSQSKIIPDEIVEYPLAAPEQFLDTAPISFVKARLLLFGKPHQDEIPDQVGRAEIHTGGVEALEDELRVVDAAVERDVHEQEAIETPVYRFRVGVFEQFTEEVIVVAYPC